jgi:murein DD-endopeptidase MepM/ murein hydrolase activator NlpD
MTRNAALFILLSGSTALLLSCTSTRPAPSRNTETAKVSPPTTPEERDEQTLSQWQEEKHKNFFDWPVDEARMSRGFLPNRKKPHLGIDLAAPKGTKIMAAHDGMVIYTGRGFHGYGKMVMIEGANGWATLYAHFSTINVKEGQMVQQGDVIGGMGRTGHATGVHLHFEIRKSRGPVDPLLYLPKATRLAHR